VFRCNSDIEWRFIRFDGPFQVWKKSRVASFLLCLLLSLSLPLRYRLELSDYIFLANRLSCYRLVSLITTRPPRLPLLAFPGFATFSLLCEMHRSQFAVRIHDSCLIRLLLVLFLLRASKFSIRVVEFVEIPGSEIETTLWKNSRKRSSGTDVALKRCGVVIGAYSLTNRCIEREGETADGCISDAR